MLETFGVSMNGAGLEKAAKLLLVGILAGVLFYAVNKYALSPAEAALNLPTAA